MTQATPDIDPSSIPAMDPLLPFDPHASTKIDGTTVDDTAIADFGALSGFIGKWKGPGLNVIWTPSHAAVTGSAHFLQLAATEEVHKVAFLDGAIPNRGLDQPDLFMAGVRYRQKIKSGGATIHFEDGVWLSVPATTAPPVLASVARMGSIPHGTTINAQGLATAPIEAAPTIPPASITPFVIGDPSQTFNFPEQDLSQETPFRTPDPAAHGFDQAMIDNINSFLVARVPADVTSTIVLNVDTRTTGSTVPGGGTANTAFLTVNADAVAMQSTIWLLSVAGEAEPSLMFYSQNVSLDFSGLTWPHITVGALSRVS